MPSTPPEAPAVLLKQKTLYSYWLKLYRKISKPERFGIGERIDKLFIELLESAQDMRFARRENKIQHIDKILFNLNKIRFLTEVSWENKLISTKEYSEFISGLEKIGKELGGWKKELTKTPAEWREKH